jgi:branched-chain amino acid aminotransferase
MSLSATTSVLTALVDSPGARDVAFGGNSMQHGTAVFEGIRCYRGRTGVNAFRLDDHLRRLLASARALGVQHRFGMPELRGHVLRAAATSGLTDQYVRPVLYCGQPRLGVDLGSLPYSLGVEIWPPAPTSNGLGLRLTISPWRRPGRSSFPVGAKTTGIYVISAIAKTQASQQGYDDALQLDPDSGLVAEATIANVFVVRGGCLVTPWTQDSLLPGITRRSVLDLAGMLGIEAAEKPVTPDELLDADEVFLTGTAMGLVPVAAVDERSYPPEHPVFDALNDAYTAAVTERRPCPVEWLTPLTAAAHSQG